MEENKFIGVKITVPKEKRETALKECCFAILRKLNKHGLKVVKDSFLKTEVETKKGEIEIEMKIDIIN